MTKLIVIVLLATIATKEAFGAPFVFQNPSCEFFCVGRDLLGGLLAGFGKRSAEENVTITDHADTDLAPHRGDGGVPQQLPRTQPGAVHQHIATPR